MAKQENVFVQHTKPTNGARRRTYAGKYDSENKVMTIGVAECNDNDQFSRKIGRAMATGRAEKSPRAEFSAANAEEARAKFYSYTTLYS